VIAVLVVLSQIVRKIWCVIFDSKYIAVAIFFIFVFLFFGLKLTSKFRVIRYMWSDKWPAIKDFRSQGEGGLSGADIFRTRGERSSSNEDVRTFWCKKLRIFRNLWCVRTDKGVNFLRFCAKVLDGRLLTWQNGCRVRCKPFGKNLYGVYYELCNKILLWRDHNYPCFCP